MRAGIENGAARQPRGPAFAARSPGLMLLNLAPARSTLILGIGPVTDGVQMAADESGRPAALLWGGGEQKRTRIDRFPAIEKLKKESRIKRLLVIVVSLLAGDDLIVLPNPRKLKAVSLEEAFNAARTIRAYPKTPSCPLRAFRGAVGSRRQAV